MNPHQLKRFFPRASQSTIAANAADYGTGQPAETAAAARRAGAAAKLERRSGNAALGAFEGKKAGTGRVLVRFVSVRKRLCDPDNLCEKWATDCLRYTGIILGDEPDKIAIETTQRKATRSEEEHTLIELFEL